MCATLAPAPTIAQVVTPADIGPFRAEGNFFLPGATFQDGQGIIQSTDQIGTLSGTFTSTDGGTITGASTTSTNQAVSANLSMTAGSNTVFGIAGKSTATLNYVMYINGTAGQTVSVNVNAKGAASITNSRPQSSDTELQATMLIQNPDVNFSVGFGKSETKGFFAPDIAGFSWSVDQDYQFKTNTYYFITLQAWAESQTNSSGAVDVSAFVDPYFSIDDPNADQYSLVFSQGITNQAAVAPGVPEPASWALMLGGFGLVGGALRARKRTGVRFA